jgi:tetratricopeptide (TPR) repeat protein
MQRAERLAQEGNCAAALPILDRAIPAIPLELDADRSQGYLQLGKCLLAAERPGDALPAFQHAVRLDPGNLDARLELGSLYVLGGLPQEAVPLADQVLARQPQDPRGRALLGAIALASGQPGEAERMYQAAFDTDPKRPEIALAFADVLNRANKPDQAAAVLGQGAQASGDAQLWLTLARFEEHRGNVTPAESAYRAAVKAQDTADNNLRLAQFLQRLARTSEAEEVLRHVDELQPAKVSAVADFFAASGRPGEALARYARRLFGDESRPADPERSALVARMVEAELASSQTADHARIILQQNLAFLTPVEIAALRAQIALKEGALADAQREAEKASQLGPENTAAQFVRGLVLYRLGKTDEASAAWVRALELDPDHTGARLMLAKQQLAENQIDGAEHAIISAVRTEPANLRVLDVYGRVLLAKGRIPDAKAIWARANTIAPGQLIPKLLAGEIALAEKNLAIALIIFQRAVTDAPDCIPALDGLLRVYRYGRFTKPMLRKVEKVAASPPASAALMEITGRLYAEQGWDREALHALLLANGLRSGTARASGSGPELIAALDAQVRGDRGTAMHAYEAALKQGPLSSMVANNLAWLYAEQGGPGLDRALELAREAHAAAPEDPAVLDTLGYVHLQRREFSDAVSVLRKALRLSSAEHRHVVESHLQQAFAGAGDPVPTLALP